MPYFPPAGAATPGGSTLQVQYNNAGAFGGMSGTSWDNTNLALTINGATVTASNPILNLSQTWNAAVTFTGVKLNITDTSSNAASLLMDLQKGGTSQFNVDKNGNATAAGSITAFLSFIYGANANWHIDLETSSITSFIGNVGTFSIKSGGANLNGAFGFVNGSTSGGAVPDTSLSRVVAKVVAFGDGAANANGWMQWAGGTRIDADFSVTSSTVLVNVTGSTKNLSVNVLAGRTYHWEVDIPFTDAAAGGIQAAMGGTATWTNIIYDGWIVDSAANGIKGNAQATAIGTAVASAVTTGTAGHVKISGTGTVNLAGTLTTQIAQNTSNATATTAKRGSVMIVDDIT